MKRGREYLLGVLSDPDQTAHSYQQGIWLCIMANWAPWIRAQGLTSITGWSNMKSNPGATGKPSGIYGITIPTNKQKKNNLSFSNDTPFGEVWSLIIAAVKKCCPPNKYMSKFISIFLCTFQFMNTICRNVLRKCFIQFNCTIFFSFLLLHIAIVRVSSIPEKSCQEKRNPSWFINAKLWFVFS